MLALSILFVSALLVPISSSRSCPDDWIVFGDSCIFVSLNKSSWQDANSDCTVKSNTSRLLNIRDEHDDDLLEKILANITNGLNTTEEFYIGLYGRKVNGSIQLNFRWTDDSIEYNFTNWRYVNETNATLFHDGDQMCVFYDRDFKWRLVSSSRSCPDDWIVFGDSCIFVSPNKSSWQDANADCTVKSNTSRLLNIRDEHDDDLLEKILANITNGLNTTEEFYIGLYGRKVNGSIQLNFRWTDDNIEYNFTNWRYVNETNATLFHDGDQMCVFYDRDFKWRLVSSSRSCPDDWIVFGDSCIFISPNKSSWQDANADCIVKSNTSRLLNIRDEHDDDLLEKILANITNGLNTTEETDGLKNRINGSTDQRINGSTDQRINGSTDQRINGSTDQWINGSTDQRMKGSTDERINGSTDERNNG
ncbi:hypothetical protein QZH41_000983 [Actinostola sp. cb2023]|nr:hypothetical protein QZH41_000983 [Actinostola sp. cb2023]